LAVLAGVVFGEALGADFAATLLTGFATGFLEDEGTALAMLLEGVDFLETGTEMTFFAGTTDLTTGLTAGLADVLATGFAVTFTGALAGVLTGVLALAGLAFPLALAAGLATGLEAGFADALATGLADFLTPDVACDLTGFFGF
jgi:hypothetical protein